MVSDDGQGLEGEWHAARSSLSRPAVLTARDGSFAVAGEGGEPLVAATADEVEISARVGSVPRRFTFPDGSLFETRDNDGADRLARSLSGRTVAAIHWLEQFRLRLAVVVVAALLLGVATYRFALPVLVEVAVAVTPPALPAAMSSGTLSALDRTVFSPSDLDDARREEILAAFDRLAAHAEGGAGAYRLNFRKGRAIGPNAFALPDGTVVLTDELVELAGDDTEMIAGVLGHEIGHVEHRHSLRQLYRAAGLAGLVMLIAGDAGAAVEDILSQGGVLLALSYSRDAEREADRRSVELMRAAGMEPAAVARFFALLEQRFGMRGDANMLSTHPGTPERRQAILDYAAALEAGGRN